MEGGVVHRDRRSHVLRHQKNAPQAQTLHELVDVIRNGFLGVVTIGGDGTFTQAPHVGSNDSVTCTAKSGMTLRQSYQVSG